VWQHLKKGHQLSKSERRSYLDDFAAIARLNEHGGQAKMPSLKKKK
jgi:hypothetical protein